MNGDLMLSSSIYNFGYILLKLFMWVKNNSLSAVQGLAVIMNLTAFGFCMYEYHLTKELNQKFRKSIQANEEFVESMMKQIEKY